MKLELDENLPESLVQELAGRGHDVDMCAWKASLDTVNQRFGRRLKKRGNSLSHKISISRTFGAVRRERTTA